MKAFDRINIKTIFIKHFQTFYDFGLHRISGKRIVPLSDTLVFIILPIILSEILIVGGFRLTLDYINIITTSLSIFVGLLFNLLILLFDLAKKQKSKIESAIQNTIEHVKLTIIKELYANISFAIALSIFSIATSVLTIIKPKDILIIAKQFQFYKAFKEEYIFWTNFAAIFLVIEFLFTLLMILKRFYLLFNEEMTNT